MQLLSWFQLILYAVFLHVPSATANGVSKAAHVVGQNDMFALFASPHRCRAGRVGQTSAEPEPGARSGRTLTLSEDASFV
jgi:hypothetical protein